MNLSVVVPVRVLPWLICLTFGLAGGVRADDWNQWRGPNRDGKATDFQAPSQWPKSLKRVWKVTVGEGHSSPLIVGPNVYQMSREGENEVVRCLTLATGSEVWKKSYPASYEMHPAAVGHGKGPKSTPLYDRLGRLYTFGISGILSCFRGNDGRLVWRRDFSKEYPKTSPDFGASVSPLILFSERVGVREPGTLIVHVGGKEGGALTAFNAATGAVRWKWEGDGPAYTSPIVVRVDGRRQLVTQSQKHCLGLDPDSGKLLWKIPFTTPYEQNIVTPVVYKDLIIFGGISKPTFACRLEKSGTGWEPKRVWEAREASMYMSSPVVSGSRIYGMSERRRGQLFTLDAATGKLLWTNEGSFAENAALLDLSSAVLILTPDADLRVMKKDGDRLTQIARYSVAESPTWATPALHGNKILIKDKTALTLWEVSK